MEPSIKTKQELENDMLSNISNDYEKSPGFLTRDLTTSNAIEMSKLYEYAKTLIDKFNVDNLFGDELTRYVFQRRGIKRKLATKAKVLLSLTGTGTINIDDIFSTSNNIQFISLETKEILEEGNILSECIEPGLIGMVGANSITQFPITLPGFNTVINISPSYDGFAEESDQDLRDRYYEDLQNPITSNNIYHFKAWAKEVSGVGDAKVFPTWNGANTTKVLIVDSNKQVASLDLINRVQEYIDPMADNRWGKGYGQAAIGSFTTVESAIAKNIIIEASIIKENGYTDEMIIENISNKVTEYLRSIALSESSNYVSHAKIVSLILTSQGVVDASNIKVNGSLTDKVTVLEDEVAVLSTVLLV